MPHCEYCNINPCRPPSGAVSFIYRDKHFEDRTVTCLAHHYSLTDLADCAFAQSGCVLCELFLLSWRRSGYLGENTWQPSPAVYPPDGDERFQIRWLIEYFEQNKRTEQGKNKNMHYRSGRPKGVFISNPSLDDRLYLSWSPSGARRCPSTLQEPGLDLWAIPVTKTGNFIQWENLVAHLDFYFKRGSCSTVPADNPVAD
jgi:hypothetical protein